MIAVQKIGRGLSGCVRYVLGEGRDPKTGRFRERDPDNGGRVAWIGGQGFEGWTPESREGAELARRVMEYAAITQTSKTRRCEKDCLHLILSWRTGETPTRDEMTRAAKEALRVLGMGRARALFVAHSDTKHVHLHIVASRIDPKTGRGFRDSYSHTKLQNWAQAWEHRHGQPQCPARERRHRGQVVRRTAHQVKSPPVRNPAGAAQSGTRHTRHVGAVRHVASVWRASARAATKASARRLTVTGKGARRIGGHVSTGWNGSLRFAVRCAWRPAARKHTARQGRRDERQPFRPHRHGKGFTCNGCKEWHPDGVMHCDLV